MTDQKPRKTPPPCEDCGISYDIAERSAAIDLFSEEVYFLQCPGCGRFTKEIKQAKTSVSRPGAGVQIVLETVDEKVVEHPALTNPQRPLIAEDFFEPVLTVIEFWKGKLSVSKNQAGIDALSNVANCVEDQIIRFMESKERGQT